MLRFQQPAHLRWSRRRQAVLAGRDACQPIQLPPAKRRPEGVERLRGHTVILLGVQRAILADRVEQQVEDRARWVALLTAGMDQKVSASGRSAPKAVPRPRSAASAGTTPAINFPLPTSARNSRRVRCRIILPRGKGCLAGALSRQRAVPRVCIARSGYRAPKVMAKRNAISPGRDNPNGNLHHDPARHRAGGQGHTRHLQPGGVQGGSQVNGRQGVGNVLDDGGFRWDDPR
jgi:hypothetical protein